MIFWASFRTELMVQKRCYQWVDYNIFDSIKNWGGTNEGDFLVRSLSSHSWGSPLDCSGACVLLHKGWRPIVTGVVQLQLMKVVFTVHVVLTSAHGVGDKVGGGECWCQQLQVKFLQGWEQINLYKSNHQQLLDSWWLGLCGKLVFWLYASHPLAPLGVSSPVPHSRWTLP